MKFENKYIDAKGLDKFEFEYSYVTKSPKLGQCRVCSSMTKWFDVLFSQHACSEECLSFMWREYKKSKSEDFNFEDHFSKLKLELKLLENVEDKSKDIIVVVRNQLSYFKQCIESIRGHTKNYHLYIWDNGSSKETQDYINSLLAQYDPEKHRDWSITSMRSEINTGFIFPNNELVAWGDSDYIIPLNSDTKVFEGWDKLMVGFLESNSDVGQVGYWGGHLGPDGRGFGGSNGYDVDYIPGWCFCISRKTYEEIGLFNKQLNFAYCEDADLSLRIKESGKKIYSLYANLVHHYQNKTIREVEKEGDFDVAASFSKNHEYINKRWGHYLQNDRVLIAKNAKI